MYVARQHEHDLYVQYRSIYIFGCIYVYLREKERGHKKIGDKKNKLMHSTSFIINKKKEDKRSTTTEEED
jgi:hypothetical protein